MSQTATITVRVRDSAGNETSGVGTVTLHATPVIASVDLNPSTLPASGGVVDVQINATHPDGLPLTYPTPTVSVGTITPTGVGRFSWAIPAMP